MRGQMGPGKDLNLLLSEMRAVGAEGDVPEHPDGVPPAAPRTGAWFGCAGPAERCVAWLGRWLWKWGDAVGLWVQSEGRSGQDSGVG